MCDLGLLRPLGFVRLRYNDGRPAKTGFAENQLISRSDWPFPSLPQLVGVPCNGPIAQYFRTGVDYTFNFLPILGVRILILPTLSLPNRHYCYLYSMEGKK